MEIRKQVLVQVLVLVRERRQIPVQILPESVQAQAAVAVVIGQSIGLRLFLSPVFCLWVGIPKLQSPYYNQRFFL